MAIETTQLFREVEAIVREGQGISHYRLECRLLAGKTWVNPTLLQLYSLERDYENSYGDVVVIEASFGLGTYAYQLVPNRDQLWVDVTATPLFENTDTQRSDLPRRTKRYRAVLMEQENPGLQGRTPQSTNEEDLNRLGLKSVQLQLLDEGIHQIRMITVGRLYRKVVPMEALRSLLTETTALVDSANQQQVFGVNVVEGFNRDVRDHVIVPHGTALSKVPELLQNEQGGLYSTGVGCYLQHGQWYVFPTYDIQRFTQTPKSLTVLNVPSQRYLGAERTYRRTTNQVVVVAAGEVNSQDEGLYSQLNQGNAVRFTDARNLLSGFGQTQDNRTLVSRRENLFEFQGPALQSGMTNVQWSSERATANPMKHYTQMTRRNGRYVSVQWLHGDASLLYPGMPVKFMTVSEDRLVTLYGILLGVHEQRVPKEAGPIARQYPASLQLKLFLSRTEGL